MNPCKLGSAFAFALLVAACASGAVTGGRVTPDEASVAREPSKSPGAAFSHASGNRPTVAPESDPEAARAK